MIKNKTGKDFWSGVMFLCFAAVGLFASRGYSTGTAGKMGPGFFPMMLAIALSLLGLLLVARALTKGDKSVSTLSFSPLFFLALAVIFFGITIGPLGLVLSLLLTLGITAFASHETRLGETVFLAIGLAALSVGVFHFALRLPMPILPTLLTAG